MHFFPSIAVKAYIVLQNVAWKKEYYKRIIVKKSLNQDATVMSITITKWITDEITPFEFLLKIKHSNQKQSSTMLKKCRISESLPIERDIFDKPLS